MVITYLSSLLLSRLRLDTNLFLIDEVILNDEMEPS